MNLQDILKKIDPKLMPEIMEKVRNCKDVGEMSKLAAANGIQLSDEEIQYIFNVLHDKSPIEDDELSQVNGGFCVCHDSHYEGES